MNKHEKALVERAAQVGVIAEKGHCSANVTGWMLSDAETRCVFAGGSPLAFCLSFEEAKQLIETLERLADNGLED